MAVFRPLFREAALAFYRWAQREIDPLHPDVPRILERISRLTDERGQALRKDAR